jgi:hypothetical protein
MSNLIKSLAVILILLVAGCSNQKQLEQEHRTLTQYYQKIKTFPEELTENVLKGGQDVRNWNLPDFADQIRETEPQFIDIIKTTKGKQIRADLVEYRTLWLDVNGSVKAMIIAATGALDGQVPMTDYEKIYETFNKKLSDALTRTTALRKSIEAGLKAMREKLEQ